MKTDENRSKQGQRRALHEFSSSSFGKMISRPLQACFLGDEVRKDSGIMTCVEHHSREYPPSSQASTVAGSSMDSDEFYDAKGTPTATDAPVPPVVETMAESVVSDSFFSDVSEEDEFEMKNQNPYSFTLFRLSYLIVTLVIMLADGLQGTHLYVLYEGYGFSVASLYSLGFITGALTAPITGPLIDKFGRKKAALLYCFLEVGINMLEQFPFLSGLVVSRVVGGITTNLLSTVFEAWLDTESRHRGFSEEQYETLMRDSVVVSNLAAIASGYLAHVLAEKLGPVGPFEGAVTCTAVAFVVVFFLWTENYGSLGKEGASKSVTSEMKDTFNSIKSDTRILRVCITQGLTMGSLHIFIFLWSPVLKDFAINASGNTLGLDSNGDPAYGLIFGAFMAAGVIGGLSSPIVRKVITFLLSPMIKTTVPEIVTIEGQGEVRPMAIEFQGAICYFLCAFLLFVPFMLPVADASSFSTALIAFIIFEFLVGVYFPCEGVMRSLYMPADSRGTMMTIPRIIVNVAVSLGVVCTEIVSQQTALGIISLLMMVSGVLQLSLVKKKEWDSLFGRIEHVKRRSMQPVRSLSMSVIDFAQSRTKTDLKRSVSSLEGKSWLRRGSSTGPDTFPDLSNQFCDFKRKEKSE